jgi:predicted RNA-binding Zn-ribbon protein involved in translation (DUF1610 family)
MTTGEQQRYECAECGWLGTGNDMRKVPYVFPEEELRDIACTSDICPECGSDEFYKVNSTFGINREAL